MKKHYNRTNTGLKEHVKTVHHDKKPNECFCGNQYNSSSYLKEHIRKVHNKSEQPKEKSFMCVTCNKGKIFL